jgi:hypothetical protein
MGRSCNIMTLLQVGGGERLCELTWVIGIIWCGLKTLWLGNLGFERIVWEE